jgi:hypothetical protein
LLAALAAAGAGLVAALAGLVLQKQAGRGPLLPPPEPILRGEALYER